MLPPLLMTSCQGVPQPPAFPELLSFHLQGESHFPLKMGTPESPPPQEQRRLMVLAASLPALVESFLSTLVSPLEAASLVLHLPPTLGQQKSSVPFPKE